MPTPIQYPTTGGSRHSAASAELKIQAGSSQFIWAGWKKISYMWELTPVAVYGNHPDPIGWTVGQAKYEMEMEVYLAEYNYLLMTLGQGFAVQQLLFTVSYSENGFDTIVDTISGVRLASGQAEMQNNADPLARTVKLMPLKILPNGVDLLAIPLQGVPAAGIPAAPSFNVAA